MLLEARYVLPITPTELEFPADQVRAPWCVRQRAGESGPLMACQVDLIILHGLGEV